MHPHFADIKLEVVEVNNPLDFPILFGVPQSYASGREFPLPKLLDAEDYGPIGLLLWNRIQIQYVRFGGLGSSRELPLLDGFVAFLFGPCFVGSEAYELVVWLTCMDNVVAPET
jgi:hypothetical protein